MDPVRQPVPDDPSTRRSAFLSRRSLLRSRHDGWRGFGGSVPQERDENVRDLVIVALMVQNQLGTHALARCLRQIPVCHGQLANAE